MRGEPVPDTVHSDAASLAPPSLPWEQPTPSMRRGAPLLLPELLPDYAGRGSTGRDDSRSAMA